jgi:hypothetical protein
MQFCPVNGSWCFKPPQHLSHEINLWRLFDFYELMKNYRQIEGGEYLEVLDRLRVGNANIEDYKLLCTRIFDSSSRNDFARFSNALALFPENKSVSEFNAGKTGELRIELQRNNRRIYPMKAFDVFADGKDYDKRCPDHLIPKNDKFSAGIPNSIDIGIGSRIMLRRNLSLKDGKII